MEAWRMSLIYKFPGQIPLAADCLFYGNSCNFYTHTTEGFKASTWLFNCRSGKTLGSVLPAKFIVASAFIVYKNLSPQHAWSLLIQACRTASRTCVHRVKTQYIRDKDILYVWKHNSTKFTNYQPRSWMQKNWLSFLKYQQKVENEETERRNICTSGKPSRIGWDNIIWCW